MIRLTYPLVLMLLLSLMACNSPEKDPKLEAAFQIHEEAIALGDSLEGYLSNAEGSHWDSLRQAHNYIQIGSVT